jgi:hypothetical protein
MDVWPLVRHQVVLRSLGCKRLFYRGFSGCELCLQSLYKGRVDVFAQNQYWTLYDSRAGSLNVRRDTGHAAMFLRPPGRCPIACMLALKYSCNYCSWLVMHPSCF